MSFLSEIHSYITGNTTITAALPANKIYTGVVPEAMVFPYAVIVPLSLVPTFTTGSDYFASFGFQISIYDTDPDNVEAVAEIIAGQFDYKQISETTISCERTNGPVFMVDPDSPEVLYHAWIEYTLIQNRSMPA